MLKQFSSCVKTLTAPSSWLGSQVLQIRLDFMEAFLKDEAKQDSAVNAYVTAVFQMVTANKAIDHADVTRTLKSQMPSQVRFSSTVMARTFSEAASDRQFLSSVHDDPFTSTQQEDSATLEGS